jgi:hydroxymethylpyrimidine pyrophosphatase-like HAD family hydrolase
MARYDGIMIASDLDGTFLGKKSRIVQENVDAVRAFCAEGGLFTFATGRHHGHILQVLPETPALCNIPVIFANGSYLYDYATGRVLSETFMDIDRTWDMLRYVRAEHRRIGFRMTTPLGFITDGRTDFMRRFIADAREDFYHVEVAPMEGWTQRLWYKAVFRGASEDVDALSADLRAHFGGMFEFNRSSPTFFEVQRFGCSKGTMLEVLRRVYEQRLGRPIKTYGVGNHENDRSMIMAADVGVCPSDADVSALSVATLHLCPHDEGTLSDLIARL